MTPPAPSTESNAELLKTMKGLKASIENIAKVRKPGPIHDVPSKQHHLRRGKNYSAYSFSDLPSPAPPCPSEKKTSRRYPFICPCARWAHGNNRSCSRSGTDNPTAGLIQPWLDEWNTSIDTGDPRVDMDLWIGHRNYHPRCQITKLQPRRNFRESCKGPS